MKPDLDTIRARAQSVETDSSARACDALLAYDALSLLAYVEELERDLLNERATFESCNRARQHCEHECAMLKARPTYTVGEAEWAHRIAVAEQRFVDEYDLRKIAEQKMEEARNERDEAECEDVKLREAFLRLRVETGRHRKAAALSEERALTAEERLEQMAKERDEARAQLAAVDTGSPCDGHRHCCADRRKLAEELLRVRAERDALRSSLDRKIRHCDEITEERDALKDKHAPSK